MNQNTAVVIVAESKEREYKSKDWLVKAFQSFKWEVKVSVKLNVKM